MATFQLFFSVQGTGGSPTGPDPENRVVDQDIGSPGRPVSSGLEYHTVRVKHRRVTFVPISVFET